MIRVVLALIVVGLLMAAFAASMTGPQVVVKIDRGRICAEERDLTGDVVQRVCAEGAHQWRS